MLMFVKKNRKRKHKIQVSWCFQISQTNARRQKEKPVDYYNCAGSGDNGLWVITRVIQQGKLGQ